jgi:hypothetical protein
MADNISLLGWYRGKTDESTTTVIVNDRTYEYTSKRELDNLSAICVQMARDIVALDKQKNSAYKERNQCVALIAKMAYCLGWSVALGRHVLAEGEEWDSDWMNIVYIQIPAYPEGQISWHIHDSELPLFNWMPRREVVYDGHTTDENYKRMAKFVAYSPDFHDEYKTPTGLNIKGVN